jgi:folate-binding protein YgfZ
MEQRGILRVSGREAKYFLQGLITNDVEQVDESSPIYAALLTPQGKFLHDFLVIKIGDSLCLDTEKSRLPDLVRRLTMYRLRAAVDLEDISEGMTVYSIFGADSAILAGEVTGVFIRDPRHVALGYRLYHEADSRLQHEKLNIQFVDPDAYEAHRIALGVPDGSRDIPVEKAFPLEYGFDSMNAVSYEKGCYVGQELTARTHNRGKVKKALYRLRFGTDSPETGTNVCAGADAVGEVLTTAGHFALAHVRIDAADGDQPLRAGEAAIIERIEAPVLATG